MTLGESFKEMARMVPVLLKIDTIGPCEEILEEIQQWPFKLLRVVIFSPWIIFSIKDKRPPGVSVFTDLVLMVWY